MIFEVTPAHIEALSDTDLRTLIGYLSEREVVNAGCSASSVTYGGHQNAKDGGIDVRVAADDGTVSGYVPRTQCGFQAKAESFAPADIGKEMRPGGKLRESICALGEANGAYVIVSSKGSVSDASLEARRKAMAAALADEPSAKGLLVDFYDKRRIASWVNQHPGIIAWVRNQVGQPFSGWSPFQDWSSSPTAEDGQYVLDDGIRLVGASLKSEGLKAEAGINHLRTILNKPKGAVRLVGLSGVGKTRLVQALFDDRVGKSPLTQQLAVYTDMGDNPDPVPAELLSRIQNGAQRCILIVDNCGADLHRKLVARLSSDSAISLITIEYDISDDESEKTDVFKLEPASKEVIQKILKPRFPNLTDREMETIADFSEGNFRIALALANTSKNGHSLANLKDRDLFIRLFHQKNDDNPALLRAAKVCSLVYSFDAETLEGAEAELPLLAALAEQSVTEFNGHVAELKRRQLVQKRSRWRALLPHALAHRLAKQALEDIPASELKTKFIDLASERLLKSFSRRLGCLHDSEEARRIVDDWLASGGMISDVDALNELGVVILDNVAPVSPKAVLKSIQAAAVRRKDFFDSNVNAQGLVRLLRALAYEPTLFDGATDLIARFARSKTESNNLGEAINVFKSLFHLVLSGTHAPIRQRTNFVRKLAASAAQDDETLVLAALEATLKCSHFMSSYGFDFGTRRRDYGFYPATRFEQTNWYAEAFLLARDLAKNLTFRNRVRTMMAVQLRSLALHVNLNDLISLAEEFADDGGWPEGWVGVRGAIRTAKTRKANDAASQLSILEAKLSPASLAHRIASYVLPGQWGALDLADVDIDDDKKYEKTRKQIEEICEGIAQELALDLNALKDHMPQMLQAASERAFTVAKAVGRGAADPMHAWQVIANCALISGSSGKVYSFPGGFLAGLAEKDWALANALLDEALGDPRWHPYLAHMQMCVGIDHAGCKRLIAAITLPSVPVWTFQNLSVGRATDDLIGSDFNALMTAIAAREDGIHVALHILYMRAFSLRSDKKPISDAEREAARTLLAGVAFEEKKNREPHVLAEIVKYCLREPEDAELVRELCGRLLDAIDTYKVSPWDYTELVTEIAGRFPTVALEEFVERGGAAEGRRGLFGSFRAHRPCPLRKIDDGLLLAWAHEKPETRFAALAGSVLGWRSAKGEQDPDASYDDDDVSGLKWTPAALRLIDEAPDPVAVLEEFGERFHPSGWSGSLAEILAGRQPLLEVLANDADKRIANWAKAASSKLAEETERCRQWEAEHDRGRDERFEW